MWRVQRTAGVLATLLLAGFLVMQPVATLIVGPASASHNCDFTDSATLAFASTVVGEDVLGEECRVWHSEEDVDTSELDAQQVKLDIYGRV